MLQRQSSDQPVQDEGMIPRWNPDGTSLWHQSEGGKMANNGPQVVTSSAEERDEGHCEA
jgi:hypothetical protein